MCPTGMALEELQSKGDSSINTDDIITCYECAGDVAMWLMAGQKTSSSLVIPPLPGEMGTALEVAIQRAPILHIKAGYGRITDYYYIVFACCFYMVNLFVSFRIIQKSSKLH